jgi:hypothetical protein
MGINTSTTTHGGASQLTLDLPEERNEALELELGLPTRGHMAAIKLGLAIDIKVLRAPPLARPRLWVWTEDLSDIKWIEPRDDAGHNCAAQQRDLCP